MKTLTVVLLLLLAATPAFCQTQTLLRDNMEYGGFGGPVLKLTKIDQDFGLLIGGKGAWIINHTYTIGGGGYALVSDIKAGSIMWALDSTGDNYYYYDMSYGGAIFGYVHRPHELVHVSADVLIGGGSVGYSQRDIGFSLSNGFFVVEPELTVMMNVSHNLRAGAGLSYRYVSGVDLSGVSDADLRWLSANLTVKFGHF